ncbi:MAG: hypothetical protein V4492_01730 [Chlamydiota bacterium]
MPAIRNLHEAYVFTQTMNQSPQMKVNFTDGYEIVREDGSTECKARFTASKAMNHNDHLFDLNTESRMKTRNITLWNKLDCIEGKFQRVAFKAFLIFLCILHPTLALLPLIDWTIGHLRNDQEIVSFHKYTANPSAKQPSPITHYASSSHTPSTQLAH